MIAKLIEFSIRNKLLVLLMTAALIGAGIWAAMNSSIDAIPDLSDVQVIVITDYPGQAPQVVEDQVTYPLTTAFSAIGAKAVRGFSMFETSMVYIIFPDGTDLHTARGTRVGISELREGTAAAGHRAQARPRCHRRRLGLSIRALSRLLLPRSSARNLARHETKSWYADPSDAPADRRDCIGKSSRLRSPRHFSADRQAAAFFEPGFGEPAKLAGLVSALSAHQRAWRGGSRIDRRIRQGISDRSQAASDCWHTTLPVKDIMMAVQRSNNDVGGSVIEMSENEYMVRSRGYLHGLADLAKVAGWRG